MAGDQRPVDMELKNAFRELQTKMITTSQQIKVADMQIEQLKKQMQHSKLVEKELSVLSSDIKTYEGVGRMFVLQPLGTVQSNLSEKVKSCEEKMKSIETSKVYLEKSIRESEGSLRELIQSKKREQTH